ncbi:MAG: filamentous hemagglutinin N-terminal domain-containing protein, partial [Cyanobacteria bacterium J06636_28]
MDRFQTLRRSRVQTLYFWGITTLGLWGLEHTGSYAQVVSAQDSIQTQVIQYESQFDIVGGTLADEGTLLFHSFEQFDLGSSQIAEFRVASGVDTVLSRITNGVPSYIDGMIAMSGSPASLYLINPAGMLFGAEASINLAGDFTALTAERLDFTQGSFALVGDPTGVQGNVLQLHFNPDRPATITNFGDLRVDEQHSLSLIGHSVVNLGTMGGGAVNIAAVGPHKTVVFSDGFQFGFAQATQALPPWLISEGTDHAAAIEIAEDGSPSLTGSPLWELPLGTAAVGGQLSANQIQILSSHDITINPLRDEALTFAQSSSSISFVADADGNGQGSFTMAPDDRLRAPGQSIDITAADIIVGELDTSAFSAIDNSRNAGDIRLTATQGSINAASLSSTARGTLNNSGNGGDIVLSAVDTIVTGAITSATDALSNTGNAGKITLNAIAGDITTGSLNTHTSGNNNTGFGGDITLNALGRIATDDITTAATAITNNSGTAGAISLTSLGETITTDSLAADTSASGSNTGHGGDISLNATQGAISTQEITSITVSPDLAETRGGDIQLNANGDIVIDSINATGTGDGGDIEVVTQESIRVIETISDTESQASLSTTGNGTIGLTYSSEPTVPFSLGNSDVHGTMGNISTGVDTLAAPQTVTQAVSLDTIELNNLFDQTSPAVVQPTVLRPAAPPAPQSNSLGPAEATIPSVERLNSSGIQTLTALIQGPNEITNDIARERQRAISNSELIWAQIEMAFSSEFVEALAVQPDVKQWAEQQQVRSD